MKLFSHRLSEHLRHVHMDEPEVAQAYSFKATKERELALQLIRNKGNLKYSLSHPEDIIPVRFPKGGNLSGLKYLPCPHCRGLYKESCFWRHAKSCPHKPKDDERKKIMVAAEASVMMASASCSSTLASEEAIQIVADLCITQDSIGEVVLRDKLLIRFAKVLRDKLGLRRKHDISQRCRQLSRLLIQIKSQESDTCITDYYSLIKAKNFDLIISAVKALAVWHENDDGVTVFQKPGLALRLGHNLAKVAKIKFGLAFRSDDTEGEKESERFSTLHNNEWTDKVSTVALTTLKLNRINKSHDVLPLTEDLVLLHRYLEERIPELTSQLQTDPSYSVWRDLSEHTLTHIVLLNKRRGSECSKLRLQTFTERPSDWKAITPKEVLEGMSEEEQRMFDK